MAAETEFKTPFDELKYIMATYKAPDGEKITPRWLSTFYDIRESSVYKWFQKTNGRRFDKSRLDHLKLALCLMKPLGKAIRIRTT